MIIRVLPLAACLLWLACEAHFSTRAFVNNVRFSVAEIKGGLDSMMSAKYPRTVKLADRASDD